MNKILKFFLKTFYYPIPIRIRLKIGNYLLIKLSYLTNIYFKVRYRNREVDNKIRLQKGVNIIGTPSSHNGIAIISRMLGEYLIKGGLGISYINSPFKRSNNIYLIENRDVYFELNEESLKYKTNIFSINFHNMPYYHLLIGSKMAKSYNIGYFPWEIDYIDSKFKYCFNFIDEVWVYSEFVKQIFEKFFKKVKLKISVKVMNVNHIDISVKSNKTRKDFNLPEDKFLFYFTFDPYSSIPRKNPIATIKAFKDAFKDQNKNVALVVKMKKITQDLYNLNKEYCDEFNKEINDDRIIIIDETLSYPDILALANCCDCLISLHRSEGLGLNILEALELGKPTITTNYSANVEFAHEPKYKDLCYFVGYKMIPVECDLYKSFLQCSRKNKHLPQWADADIGHAGKLISGVYQKYKLNN